MERSLPVARAPDALAATSAGFTVQSSSRMDAPACEHVAIHDAEAGGWEAVWVDLGGEG